MESVGQVDRGFVKRQLPRVAPQVQGISFSTTVGICTAEDVLVEIDGETLASFSLRFVQGAGPVTLRAATTKTVEVAQLPEHLFYRHLLSQVSVIDRSTSLLGAGIVRYAGVGCGDHFFLRASYPFVARNHFFAFLCGRFSHLFIPRFLAGRLREFFIKGLVAGPYAEDLVQELPHTVPQSYVATGVLGAKSSVQIAHGGVGVNGVFGCIPQIASDNIRSFARHVLRALWKRVTISIYARTILLWEDPEVANQFLRCRKSLDINDFRDQHCRGGRSDAGN